MTESCPQRAQVDLHLDGELDAQATECFLVHLAECEHCQAALHEGTQRLALELAGAAPAAAPSGVAGAPANDTASSGTSPWLVLAAAAILLLGVGWVVRSLQSSQDSTPPERAPLADAGPTLGPTLNPTLNKLRPVEVRFSASAFDGHRPYDTLRAGDSEGAGTDPITTEELLVLERGQDPGALAAAHALRGSLELAAKAWEGRPESADRLSDEAALALLRGDPSAALQASTRALELVPEHAAARWNRALALEELELVQTAIEAFEALAGMQEAGWSDEARERAQALARRGGDTPTPEIPGDAPGDEVAAEALEASVERATQLTYHRHAYWEAIDMLREPLESCERSGEPLCNDLEMAGAAALGAVHRLGPARELLDRAMRRTRAQPAERSRVVFAYAQLLTMEEAPGLGKLEEGRAYIDEYLAGAHDCRSGARLLNHLGLQLASRAKIDAAKKALDAADALRAKGCPEDPPGLNELHGLAIVLGWSKDHNALRDTFARKLAALRADESQGPMPGGVRALVDALELRARSPREVQVIQKATALLESIRAVPADDPFGSLYRLAAQVALGVAVQAQAEQADFASVRDLVLAQRQVQGEPNCSVVIAVDREVITAVTDEQGGVHGQRVPRGADGEPPTAEDLLEPDTLARLAGCPSVDVVAQGPFAVAPELLGPERAWAYRLGGPAIDLQAPPAGQHLIVDVPSPPASLGLPKLRGVPDRTGARMLRGDAATPEQLVAGMREASLIEIHAHGVALGEGAYGVALNAGPSGHAILRPEDLPPGSLQGAPVVILAACNTAGAGHSVGSAPALAEAFLRAGASTVLAPATAIPDRGTAETLAKLSDAIRAGSHARTALVERVKREPTNSWLRDLVVFEP